MIVADNRKLFYVQDKVVTGSEVIPLSSIGRWCAVNSSRRAVIPKGIVSCRIRDVTQKHTEWLRCIKEVILYIVVFPFPVVF